MSKRCLIVGLGNPGKRYEMTRHNLGFLVVQKLAERLGIFLKRESRFEGYVGKGRVGELDVHLLLPMTFMNESGRAVQKYCRFFRLNVEELIVVTDDIALPFGKLRLRLSGSSGGHNGLKSVKSQIGTQDFARLRMGIASEWPGEDLADFVLSRFTKQECQELGSFIDQGVTVLERLFCEEFAQVMTEVNAK